MDVKERSPRSFCSGIASFSLLVVSIALLFISDARGQVYKRFDLEPSRATYPDTWDVLNNYNPNHYIAVGTDANDSDILGQGNFRAVYYDTFHTGYPDWSGKAWEYADHIMDQVTNNFNGNVPPYIFLNELSSIWANDATYRHWAIQVCYRLKTEHGRNVVMLSQFPQAANNASDWQQLANNCTYIGIECYLSGQEIKANGYSTSWCQSQYQASKNSYLGVGIAASKLMLVEHFGHTDSSAGWGRAGLTQLSNWQLAIQRRSAGSHNVGFAAFLSYGWGLNSGMNPPPSSVTACAQTYSGVDPY
ncbi:MAG TPA: hypothetical protein VHE81_10105 [Lacipirellulaceae bacterium]|nr:hypothetical protein [Lacipirellulaceae bacterium]